MNKGRLPRLRGDAQRQDIGLLDDEHHRAARRHHEAASRGRVSRLPRTRVGRCRSPMHRMQHVGFPASSGSTSACASGDTLTRYSSSRKFAPSWPSPSRCAAITTGFWPGPVLRNCRRRATSLRVAQAEQGGAGTDPQQVAEAVAHPRDVSAGVGLIAAASARSGRSSAQSLPLSCRGGRPVPKIVVLVAPVEAVEPVAGIEAVAVQRLGAQHLHAGMEVGDALAEGDQRRAEQLHARAILARGVARQLGGVDVEQGLVVVVLDVVDDFAGLRGVTGGLAACSRSAPVP